MIKKLNEPPLLSPVSTSPLPEPPPVLGGTSSSVIVTVAVVVPEVKPSVAGAISTAKVREP